ncbi:MAG: hypothetical protein FWC89_01980 [Defluviitaleaceae bacterium]|nr:hypothetical protein [Defluviitaleaceae bacterium]
MAVISSTFEWAGNLYARWFANWLHVHFLIRTVIILFALLLIIFLATQLFQYVIWPAVMLVAYHVFFRFWNFLFVETPQEWFYIRYHSRGNPTRDAIYLRLCDKAKRNRTILSNARFKNLITRSKPLGTKLMVISAVAATLWVTAFGLHHEYAAPALALVSEDQNIIENANYAYNESNGTITDANALNESDEDPTTITYDPSDSTTHGYANIPNMLSPTNWQSSNLVLNETGRQGARLRDGPGIADQTIIKILWDDASLIFLNEYTADTYVTGLFWLRVQSADGTVGYISSQLVEVAR